MQGEAHGVIAPCVEMVPEEGLEPSRPRGHGTLRRSGGGHEVYFTIHFTVRGGSRPPPVGRYAEKLKIPSLSPERLSVVGCLR